MKDPNRKIFNVYDHIKDLLSDQSINPNYKQLKKVVASIYSPGTSFQAIFDFPSRSFDKVSNNIEKLLGYSSDSFSVEKLISKVHPDDIGLVIKNEALAGLFFKKYISQEEIPFYKVTYQYRVKNSKDIYRLFLHQAITLTKDKHGLISKTFINLSDITKFGEMGNRFVSFIDIRGIRSYANINMEEDLIKIVQEGDSLTKREMEILHLISEGYNSKKIAKKLFISYDTVRTHRNNIISRNNFNSINHAVAHYIRKGVL